MVLTFTTVQDLNQAGIAILVKASVNVTNAVNCIFTDNKHTEHTKSLDHTLIPVSKMNHPDGVTIYLSDAAYDTLSVGDTVVLTISTYENGALVQHTLQPIEYKRAIPFTTSSVVDGFETVHVTIQLNKTIYDQNARPVDGYYPSVTLSQNGSVLMGDYDVRYGAPSSTGEVKITIGNPVASKPLPAGHYEVGINVNNNIGAFHESVFVDVTSDPNNVEATSFNTFDVSGGMFQLEYGAKDYSGYTDLKVRASFSQKDNSSVLHDSVWTVAEDICGVIFDAPVEWLMPDDVKDALNALNVNGAYDTEKFEVKFWIEGTADTTDDNVVNGRLHIGAKTTSKYWLDSKLITPTLSLDAIDWISGEQTMEVVEDGSFNNYTVYYDLSGSNGSASNAVMNDACGTTMEAKAEISYGYSQLLPNAAGDYKSLHVRVERPEINHLDAISPPMNKSDSIYIDYLKAVKRAAAPEVVEFTPITVAHDGSIEFAYIEASANTDIFGYLQNGVDVSGHPIVLDSASESIPAPDASNAVISFNNDLLSGTKYVMNAYSRFNLSSFNAKYRELNETKKRDGTGVGEFSDNYLLSAKTSDSNFFTEPPTFELFVRPTGHTNKLSTVRMHGESKGNNIKKMIVFVKDVCGQVLESELVVEVGQEDTCGNVVLNSGGHVDNFNTKFIQDFVFDEPVSIGIDGDMFLLGIIDTPNEVDAIGYDQTANPNTTALNTAINAYDAGVVAYNTAVDVSTNYLTNVSYVEIDDELKGWTASAESLGLLLVDTCANIMGDESVSGSNLNVAALLAVSNAETQDSSAMTQTASRMNTAILAWGTAYAAAATADKPGLKSSPVLTYTVFTASGETAFALSVAEIAVPNAGYSTINLEKTYEDYVKLVTAQETIKHTAHVAWNQSRLANEALKAKVDTLNGAATVVGSIKKAKAEMVNSAADITALFAAFASAIFTTRSALVGYNSISKPKWGTYLIPKDGSLAATMNVARADLDAQLGGIEKYKE